MACRWPEYPIEELVTLSQGLAINRNTRHLIADSGYPLLRITDLINRTVSQYIDRQQVLEKHIAQRDELIYTRTGQVGLVFKDRAGVVHNNCFKIIPNERIMRDYLYWFLSQKSVREYVNAIASGSVQKDLNHTAFKTLRVPLPPLPEQRRIANVLGTLDDKIDLNRRMNRTLEAIARAIFKSWFVDFDPVHAKDEGREPVGMDPETAALFPDSFQDSPLGEIPKGWDVSTVEDLGGVVCGKTPRTAQPENYGAGIPFITIPDMRGAVFVTRTARELTPIGTTTQPKKLLPSHSVCVSCIATPGLVSLTSEPSHTNQQINSIVCKDGISPYWCYLQMQSMSQEVIAGGSGGSATLNLNKRQFSALTLPIPPEPVQSAYHRTVGPVFGEILSLAKETASLEHVRNALLPHLMSGKLQPFERKQGGGLRD